MKIRKILISAVCIPALSVSAVSYAADFTADERGTVNFSDVFDVSGLGGYKEYDGHRYTYGDYDMFMNYKLTDKNNNLQNFGQVVLDDSGNVNFSFRIKGETGEYTLTLSNAKLGNKSYTIDYVNNIYIDFNDIKKSNDEQQMLDFLNESGSLFGLDSKAFSLLDGTQRDKIVKSFMAADDASSMEDMKKLAEGERVVDVLFETAQSDSILTEYILDNAKRENSVFNKSIAEIFEQKLSESEKSSVVSALMGSALDSSAIDKFEFGVLKCLVHGFKYFADMDTVILSEGNIWGFDESDLKRYKNCDTSGVQKDMMSAIDTAGSLKAYREKFGASITANPKESTGGSSGGKGSSGGSSVVSSGGKSQNYEVSGDGLLTPDTNVRQEYDPSSEKADFKDLDGFDWAKDAIKTLASNYIISGVTSTEFQPARTIKREEFIKLITSGLRLTGAEAGAAFADVSESDWFYDAVGAAKRAEIVTGDENGNFGAGREITRQDAAVMLARTAKFKGVTLGGENNISFADGDAVASYAASAVEKLAKAGIINGTDDGRFAPEASLTRVEAAVMLYKFFSALSVIK